MRRTIWALAALTLAVYLPSACARPRPIEASTANPHPLHSLVSLPVVVLPTRFLVVSDSLSWRSSIPASTEYLATLDDELKFALGDREISAVWKYASDVEQLAKRSPTAAEDPRSLPAVELLRTNMTVEADVGDALSRGIRSLTALTEARFVLYPVQLRLDGSELGRAQLRLVLIDSRMARVKWFGTVTVDSLRGYSPAIAANIAARVADLVGARKE